MQSQGRRRKPTTFAASMLHLAELSPHPELSLRRGSRRPAVMFCAHAESMQRQGRWRKSVRAVIAVNSMRPSSKDASAAAAANAVQEEDHEPPPGQHSGLTNVACKG